MWLRYVRTLTLHNSLGPDESWPTRRQVRKQITPSGSRAGILYGLPKVHKNNLPIRPIISAVGTYNYRLAKYLDNILKPLVDATYILTDTFDFVNKISHLDTSSDKNMVSFDVESLFTNIPTQETIDIIIKLAYADGNNTFHGHTSDDLKKHLTICTQQSHFQFAGEFYDQVDGVAMGSPLGPLFANIFMAEFEKTHMEKLREVGIKTWLRYVDDVFVTTNDRAASEAALEYLNEQHPNIKTTSPSRSWTQKSHETSANTSHRYTTNRRSQASISTGTV